MKNLQNNNLWIGEELGAKYALKLKELLLELMAKKGAHRGRPKIKITANGCWEWLWCKTYDGYGKIILDVGDKKLTTQPHRYFYQKLIGDFDKDLTIDHLCRNRTCCNPDHLEPVTRGENVLRGNAVTGNNIRKTHCVRGHEFTEENIYHIKPSTRRPGGGRSCKMCLKLRNNGLI